MKMLACNTYLHFSLIIMGDAYLYKYFKTFFVKNLNITLKLDNGLSLSLSATIN